MKKAISLTIAFLLCFGLAGQTMAAGDKATEAAALLYELKLFNGVGTNQDGTPIFALDRGLTREEAVVLLVRLLGKESEAQSGIWNIPVTDVSDWARQSVGYAYENGLTQGTSNTLFGGTDAISATEFLTFLLRAMGYSSEHDYTWNTAWRLTDDLGITNGEYNSNPAFTRGDAAMVCCAAINKKLKGSSKTLIETIAWNDSSNTRAYDMDVKHTFYRESPNNDTVFLADFEKNIGMSYDAFTARIPDAYTFELLDALRAPKDRRIPGQERDDSEYHLHDYVFNYRTDHGGSIILSVCGFEKPMRDYIFGNEKPVLSEIAGTPLTLYFTGNGYHTIFSYQNIFYDIEMTGMGFDEVEAFLTGIVI